MGPINSRWTNTVHSGICSRTLKFLSIAALASLAACAGGGGGSGGGGESGEDGGGGGGGGGGPSFGEDGGDPAPPLSDGARVTMLETKLPWLDTFILRGNIPVPPETFPRPDGLQPFTIYDYDGTPLETQTNIVTRYPNSNHGADVVEVMARVRKDPDKNYGSWVQYEVRQSPRAGVPDPGEIDLWDLNMTENMTPNIFDLFSDPQSVEIAAYDTFGNKYSVHPLDGTGDMKLMRHGRVSSEVRVFQTMLPESPDDGPSGTLPHMFGVHTYVSNLRGDDIIFLDVRFNNGHSGNDTTTTDDDPLDKLYFNRIEITVPDNWFVDAAFEDPMFGDETLSGGRRTVNLVNPIPGKEHYMRWQGQTHRRLALTTSGLRSTGLKYIESGGGQAFCTRGFDPVDGHEYWSWWNRGTARYFPQNYQLPLLDHVGNLRPREEAEYDDIREHLENGTSTGGNYPIASGNLGWAHPYGVSYGGMTGGNEVFLYDGIKTAAAASRFGTQMYKGLHRMHTDRQPTTLYDVDGEPSGVEDWVRENRYVPFEYFLHPNLGGGGDVFGVGDAPSFQVTHVEGTGRKPNYETALRNYDAHDYQHYVRYTRAPKVLLWLANDSLAKDDLQMAAEVFHFAYHKWDNNRWNGTQETGMKADQQYVAERPGVGFPFGRGEAWGIDSVLAAFAGATPEWRERKYNWFKNLTDLLADGQGACNGFIQSNVTPKNFNGMFRTRQQIEQSITENMIQGMRETVFRGRNTAYTDLTRDVLINSLNGFISDMVFVPGYNIPPSITAIGPLDINLPVWCSFAEMPAGTWSEQRDNFQDWCSFAWGYELTGNQEFLDKALGQYGYGSSLYTVTLGTGTDNIENRAALLALVQRLNGDL